MRSMNTVVSVGTVNISIKVRKTHLVIIVYGQMLTTLTTGSPQMIDIISVVAIVVFSIISTLLATLALILTWIIMMRILHLPWGRVAGCTLDGAFYRMLDMILGKHTREGESDGED